MNNEPMLGEIITLNHSRLGKAVVQVTEYVDDTWADVSVLYGTLRDHGCVYSTGDTRRVRRSFCTWSPATPPKPTKADA